MTVIVIENEHGWNRQSIEGNEHDKWIEGVKNRYYKQRTHELT